MVERTSEIKNPLAKLTRGFFIYEGLWPDWVFSALGEFIDHVVGNVIVELNWWRLHEVRRWTHDWPANTAV